MHFDLSFPYQVAWDTVNNNTTLQIIITSPPNRTTKKGGWGKQAGRRLPFSPKHPSHSSPHLPPRPKEKMAHLPPNAAIFSPSVARAAASAAKDWNFVDSWLSAHFKGRPAPPFERNADTLRALLALVALNEAADEDRDLIARADAQALRDVEAWEAERDRRLDERDRLRDAEDSRTAPPPAIADLREDILDAVEEGLTREGRAALDAVAGAAVELGIAHADAVDVARGMVDLQGRILEIETASARVGALKRHIDVETKRMEALVEELGGDEYRPAPDLARQNLDAQRTLKAATAKLPELEDRVASLAASVGTPNPTVEQVRREEEKYAELLARRKDLDARVKSFRGLPPDVDAAREDLESLRDELRRLNQRRDAVFEGLVERETPRKPRR